MLIFHNESFKHRWAIDSLKIPNGFSKYSAACGEGGKIYPLKGGSTDKRCCK